MKAYEIPVSKPVLKMLKRDYGYSKHMRIDRMTIAKTLGHEGYYDIYLNRTTPAQVRITVICPKYASKRRLYSIARMMEYEFKMKMMLFIEAHTNAGTNVKAAVHLFYDRYDISLEDLNMWTAYKQWQRYREKEQQKNLLPLW